MQQYVRGKQLVVNPLFHSDILTVTASEIHVEWNTSHTIRDQTEVDLKIPVIQY